MPNVAFHIQHTEHYKWKPYTANITAHAMHTPPTSRHTPHARCKLDIPHAYLRTLHTPLDCKLYTSQGKLHTSHWARNAQRCISHSAYWTLRSENHTLQTLQSTPCTIHPPVATLRTPDANSTFHMPTSALYTLQNHTHTEKKCKMAQGSKQVWGSRPRLKRNMPRLRKSRSRSKKSDPRPKKGIQGQKKR